jgi:threonine synthase
VDGAPLGKVQQMQLYGAETLMIKDFGLDASVTNEVMNGLWSMANNAGSSVQISAYKFSPLGMAGVQTVAYEIAEEMPSFNGHVFSPSGGGGLTLAVAKGFRIWKEHHSTYSLPKVHCVQPVGNDTIAGPLQDGWKMAQSINKSTTAISGLQVPNLIDGNETLIACRVLGGTGLIVSDELVFECQQDLATKEGIFCEPAGAVAFAGLVQAVKKGLIHSAEPVICLVTGHGFKDPVSASRISEKYRGQYFDTAPDTFKYIESNIKN